MDAKALQTLEFAKIIAQLQRHAASSLGKARAEQLRPSPDLDMVKAGLQATDEAVTVERLKGTPPFGGITDVGDTLARARIGGTLSPQELLDVANVLYGSKRLKRFLLAFHEDHPIHTLSGLARDITDHARLEQAIRSCIDDQAYVVDSASPELARVRAELRTGEARIRERLDSLIRNPSTLKMLQDGLITMRGDRYVIPVKQEYRASFGGIVHDQSASGATLFIEPEAVVQMNNKIREWKMSEEREIEKVLIRLTAQVAEEVEALKIVVEVVGELDFMFAKAGLAYEMKAALPRMNDRGFIKLRKARHPLIAPESVVPIDVELGGAARAMIVTGPNTGGKTVSLKTTALLSLMAMSGLFIPAEDGSQMCVFDQVFADIGDEQSIEQSLSTFSSHLTNIIRILKEITPKSLVLLDELGAGTDPAEGSALAISILEYVRGIGCRLLATTHYSELKAYAYNCKDVVNASMEFDIRTLSPTYRLMIGIPGRSNAFAIAERLGLPGSIIEHARAQIGEEDQKVENMIASIEATQISSEMERRQAQQLRKELEDMRAKLAEQQAKFDVEKTRLLQAAEREAVEAVSKARRQAEEIIADLRKLALEEGASIKEHKLIEARRRLDEAAPTLHRKKAHPGHQAEHVEPGDEVRVMSLGQTGHVERLVGGDEAVVQLGIMKMKVSRKDLALIRSSAERQQQVATTIVKRSLSDTVHRELDLRGSNLDDAIMEVDRFLDNAVLSNLGQVNIIHGKGTGVLRTGISDFLKRHKHVKTYRLGQFGEGGSGVTVVDLQ